MKLKKIIWLLFFCGITLNAQSQYNCLKNLEDAKTLSKKVVESFMDSKISKSFEEMKYYWPLPENEIDDLQEKTTKYLNILEDRMMGKPIGYEKIKEETLGDFAIRETYIIKYPISAIRLKFVYYKNEKGWILNSFKWDDTFSEEFK
jgi:hypothetical protein